MASETGKAGTVEAGVHWRLFLRALVDEIDSIASPPERDDLLRGIGSRMARLSPLPEVGTLAMLQLEMNEALSTLGWGSTRLVLHEEDRVMAIHHAGLPRIGSAGDPPGTWLAGLLEGLYGAWLARQPGGDAALVARRADTRPDGVVLRFGRA